MRYETIANGLLYPYYLTAEAVLQKLEHSFLSIQILMNVHPALMTVMSKLSVITLRDPLIAHAPPEYTGNGTSCTGKSSCPMQ